MNTVEERYSNNAEHRLTVFTGNKLFKALKESKTGNSKPIVVALVSVQYDRYQFADDEVDTFMEFIFRDVTNDKEYNGYLNLRRTSPEFKGWQMFPVNRKGQSITIEGRF